VGNKQCILITGASRGLGYHLHQLYAERGWTTFPLVRRESAAAGLRDAWGERCHPIVADVSNDECMPKITEVLYRHTQHLNVVVNNAGIGGRTYTISDITAGEVLDLLQAHCLGAICCTQAVLPLLQAAKHAKIVNVTSRLGSMTKNAAGGFSDGQFSYSYRIAKAAQNMFTLCLEQELAKNGIAVYSVHPGRLLTGMAADDADTPPAVAASRFVSWLEAADDRASAHCISLEDGEVPW
jgi:NAD(P)-dependent dehydrogenase (short-subunit alcohol dehydrogenase family)